MSVRALSSGVWHAQRASESECVPGAVACGTHRGLVRVSACRN